MAQDVKSALLEAAQKKQGWNLEQAEAWIKQLQDENRFMQDVWS